MIASWPDFAHAGPGSQRKVEIVEQCLCHGLSPQIAGAELAAAITSDVDLDDDVTSAWTIITAALRVFDSDEDIAKIAELLVAFASLAPSESESSAEKNSFAARSWTSLGWSLNEEWNCEFRRPYTPILAC